MSPAVLQQVPRGRTPAQYFIPTLRQHRAKARATQSKTNTFRKLNGTVYNFVLYSLLKICYGESDPSQGGRSTVFENQQLAAGS